MQGALTGPYARESERETEIQIEIEIESERGEFFGRPTGLAKGNRNMMRSPSLRKQQSPGQGTFRTGSKGDEQSWWRTFGWVRDLPLFGPHKTEPGSCFGVGLRQSLCFLANHGSRKDERI